MTQAFGFDLGSQPHPGELAEELGSLISIPVITVVVVGVIIAAMVIVVMVVGAIAVTVVIGRSRCRRDCAKQQA